MPSRAGAWYLPNGLWVAGVIGEEAPQEGVVWRGYYDCAKRILDLYVEGKGRATICGIMREEGWAYRSIKNLPVPLSNDAIVRVTKNWIEYGGVVVGQRAKDRKSYDTDPDQIVLNPDRAVFDVELLRQVGLVAKMRSFKRPDHGHKTVSHVYPFAGLVYCAHCDRLAAELGNRNIRTHLEGKGKNEYGRGSYRHRPGLKCRCVRTQNAAHLVEDEFVRLCGLLALSPEATEMLKQSATALIGMSAGEEAALEEKKTVAIARRRRKLEAIRNVYEDGDMSREDYLLKKQSLEAELATWQNYTTEAARLHIQLPMCVDALSKLTNLWENSSD